MAQSRVERFFAAFSSASISAGVRMVIRPRLVRIGRAFRIEIGITAALAINSFLQVFGNRFTGWVNFSGESCCGDRRSNGLVGSFHFGFCGVFARVFGGFLCMHVPETIKREPDHSGVRISAKPPFSRRVGIRQLLFSFILLSCELLGDDKCDKSVHFLPQ